MKNRHAQNPKQPSANSELRILGPHQHSTCHAWQGECHLAEALGYCGVGAGLADPLCINIP